MTTLLASSTATNSAATEGEVKTFLANLRTYMADLLGTDSADKAAVLGLLGSVLNGKVAKTGAYTVVAGDRGKVIDCLGTWTMNITAAATLGDGFVFAIRNSGTGAITVDPNLTEQINGLTTRVISAGEFLIVYCDGVGFSTVGGSSQNFGYQLFNSSGTFTVPSGVTAVRAYVVGGGGGGGSVAASGTYTGGGGGGGGGKAMKLITGLTAGSTVTVTIGSGGASNAAGGTTSFGAYCSATGGSAGASVSSPIQASGGAGGVGTGDITGNGETGQDSQVYPSGGFVPGAGGSTAFHILSGIGKPNAVGEKCGAGGSGGLALTGSAAGYAGASGAVLVEW